MDVTCNPEMCRRLFAGVAELADAPDLGSGGDAKHHTTGNVTNQHTFRQFTANGHNPFRSEGVHSLAKRKTPTSDPGEIRNPVKAATLMACLPKGHLPYRVTRRADGVRCVFFHPTTEFLRDSAAYDAGDLPVPAKRFLFIRSRLLEIREDSDVSELIRAVQS